MFRPLTRMLDRRATRGGPYAFMFERDDSGEVVSIDLETTGLDRSRDDIIAIAAIRVAGTRILASQRFEALVRPTAQMAGAAIKVHRLREMDVADARPIEEVLPDLLRFIGSRPLIGYYLEFDVAMLNRPLRALTGFRLPNAMIDVSELYYDRKYGDAPPGTEVDLRFASMLADLGLPDLPVHDAFNDALATAMIYVALVDYAERGIRIERRRPTGF